ncbi:Uma2 family endonuclease [Magnetovirga frankeli]|uniref:Uma2 family endonuclease n=1 Tax=Magnetovirga frankeli TaxID=947516 RepID=UPI001292D698|nr:Uma2 family endonuclease [gamma proteobacterium SS-5]
MPQTVLKPASYSDLLALPEHWVGEIIQGALETQPRPGPRHAHAQSRLGARINGPFDQGLGGPGGWWILDEPELHLGADIMVPDLAGWRRERMPSLPDTAWFELAPDWVCEILSPATARKDRVLKMPIYAREGVQHVWLLDPQIRTLEVYGLKQQHWLLLRSYGQGDPVAAPPFEALSFPLDVLWSD